MAIHYRHDFHAFSGIMFMEFKFNVLKKFNVFKVKTIAKTKAYNFVQKLSVDHQRPITFDTSRNRRSVMIRGSLRSCAIALTLLGVSIAPSGAVTIPPGGGAPGTAIPLGSNPLASITLTSPTSVTTDFFFTPSVAGTTFLSAFEGTSAGGSSLNPFSITLLNLTTSTTVGANNAPVANVTQLSLQLSGLPFISGDNYELIVSATASGTDTFPVSIDGNITVNAVNPVPLPPAAWLFGTALVGLGILARRRRTQLAV